MKLFRGKRLKLVSITDNRTTSKTKTYENCKSEKDAEFKIKDKRSSGVESNLRNFLPGEIGQYEDDNLLSIFKNKSEWRTEFPKKVGKKRGFRQKLGRDSLLDIRSQNSKESKESNTASFQNKYKKWKPPLSLLGNSKDSVKSKSKGSKNYMKSRNFGEIKTITNESISEPVSNISSTNFLNIPYEESKEE